MRYAGIFLLLCFSLSGCSVKVPVGFEDANSEAEARSFASQSSVFILKREYKNDYIFSDPLTIDLIKDENGDSVAWVSEGFRFSAVFRLYGAQRDSSGSLEMTLCNYGDYQAVNIGYGARCNFLFFYRSHSSGKYLAANYSSTRKWIETSRTSNSITFSPADQPEVAGTIMVVDGNSIYFLCEEGKPQGKGWRACFAQSSHLFGSGPKSLAASGKMYRWDWDRYYALSKQIREKGVAVRQQSEREKAQQKSDFWSGVGSALYTGLQAANEVMAEQTAQSQAELDATLRAVNAQAAAERQQEAEAAAKAQADRRYSAEQQAAYNAALAQGYSQAEASRQADAQAGAAKQREAAQAQYPRQQSERERRIAEQEREAQLNAQRVMRRFTESSSLAVAAGTSGASDEVREYQAEYQQAATAWCYQYPSSGKFICDGPLQRMRSSEDSFRYALELAGCSEATDPPPPPGESRKYGCGYSLGGIHNRVMPDSSPFP